ncbi:glucosamine-6-phosphate deaminase [Hydrogenoanaerobacterium sp.]|uniref:glucosamine-6-phosphate deaminase n=1 Tax=Hydrogenoanaerobacterium sp. TaxID=2953763 RepID=UPI00289FFEAE|nr:glucosamine-6-phosphate deaminase [Hydrogenoanaerobacterium sp.]
MKLIRAKDYNDMSRKAANVVSATVILRPNCVLGLATGSTPVGMYKQLIAWYEKGDLDFKAVKSINLDEYVGLDAYNDQGYRYFMNENLFNHVNIDKSNTSVPNGMAADVEQECRRYDKHIADLGGVDLQVLGIGNNGHIGFNEPDEAFEQQTHLVDLAQKTIDANSRFFASIDDVPKQAITMGIKSIMQAKAIILLASGEGKADIMETALFGPITPKVPASILQLHPNLTVVADEAALQVVAQKHPELF